MGTPIISQPQVAVLALGAIKKDQSLLKPLLAMLS
jgi:pyruvate/2-oxoglutarate dehydrogenase complex dihydrolipoamide acyltransferase (E2) component